MDQPIGETNLAFASSVLHGTGSSKKKQLKGKRDYIYDGTTHFDFSGLLREKTTLRLYNKKSVVPNAFGIIIASPTWGMIASQIKRCIKENFMFEYSLYVNQNPSLEENFDNGFHHKVLPINVIVWFFLTEDMDNDRFVIEALVLDIKAEVHSYEQCAGNAICKASFVITATEESDKYEVL